MTSGEAYHLSGVAGVGMSALAEVLVRRGREVSGSDRFFDRGEQREIAATLRRLGVRLFPQDGSAVSGRLNALVTSAAIESDNPEVLTARRLGVPIEGRAQRLAGEMRGGRSLVVTGTSGKSTVTAMTGWILAEAGLDPWVVVGAAVRGWRTSDRLGSVRVGASDWWVVEADESDRSLLVFEPDWALITNVSRDHFEADETRRLFDAFAGRARQGVLDFAARKELWRGFKPVERGDGVEWVYRGRPCRMALPGRHNAQNAWCALALCERLGVDVDRAAAALRSFPGLHRRLEILGRSAGVTVVDDYAHNPAKIRAAWEAMRPRARRVHVVWRPHGFGPLRNMLADLASLLADLSRVGGGVWILPVFDAGGTADRSLGARDLAEAVRRLGGRAEAPPDSAACRAQVVRVAEPGDAVLIMGARDPSLPDLARRLLEDLGARSPREQKDDAAEPAPERHHGIDQER